MTSKVHIFTSIAYNYLPKAEVLFNSIKQFHSEWQTHVLLVEREKNLEIFPVFSIDYIHYIDELDIPDIYRWCFFHSLVELATAVKPFMLLKLLSESSNHHVIYLDPDILVLSSLDDLIRQFQTHDILLTPHQSVPENYDLFAFENERCSLRHGIYNLGFIGVTNSAIGFQFAKWWAERTYYFCEDSIENGLFTDQRWIDFVPVYFTQVAILRSPRFNVAPWNLNNRHISCDKDGKYLVNDEPLGFYHFTGFDNGSHQLMAEKNSAGNKVVSRLISKYHKLLKDAKFARFRNQQWTLSVFNDGSLIPCRARKFYKNSIMLQEKYPDPYDETSYYSLWLHTNSDTSPIKYFYRSIHLCNSLLYRLSMAHAKYKHLSFWAIFKRLMIIFRNIYHRARYHRSQS